MKALLTKRNGGRRQRILALLLAAITMACVIVSISPITQRAQAFGVSADSSENAALRSSADVSQVQGLLDDIFRALRTKYSATDLQELIDKGIASDPTGSDWYILALAQYSRFDTSSREGWYDFSKCNKALADAIALRERKPTGTEIQKYALLTLTMGYSIDGFDMTALSDSIGSQGIMSLVFGLHLMSNGVYFPEHTAQETVKELLSLQKSDGGFAISGDYGDVDVTAMTLQALAPLYQFELTRKPQSSAGFSEEVRDALIAAVDRAIALLSSRQMSDGGFQSYGSPNCESCAQVLVALSALGIDAATDPRFQKDGHSVIDAMASYRLTDGQFSHIAGESVNINATKQACYACVAYLRFCHNQPALYDLDAVREKHISDVTPTPTGSPTDPTPTVSADQLSPTGGAELTQAPDRSVTPSPSKVPDNEGKKSDSTKTPAYRIYGTAILALLTVFAIALLSIYKRLTKRNVALVCISAAVLLLLLWTVKIQTPKDYYESIKVSEEDADGTVTLSIRCDTVAGENGLPSDGIILASVKIPFRDGDTVYNALAAAAADAGLPLDIGGTGSNAYIRGIGSLREFEYGSLSGWMYYVNGDAPSESCSTKKLRDGDVIEWRYTKNMGIDTE